MENVDRDRNKRKGKTLVYYLVIATQAMLYSFLTTFHLVFSFSVFQEKKLQEAVQTIDSQRKSILDLQVFTALIDKKRLVVLGLFQIMADPAY